MPKIDTKSQSSQMQQDGAGNALKRIAVLAQRMCERASQMGHNDIQDLLEIREMAEYWSQQ